MLANRMVAIITNACNLQCQHCLREFNRFTHVPLEDFRKAVRSMVASGTTLVSMTGGEPCLHPQFVNICDMLIEEGARIFVMTNGYLREKYRFLGDPKYKNPRFGISLDGMKAEHDFIRGDGSFDRVVEMIAMLDELGLRYSLQISLNNANFRSLPQVFEFASSTKATLLSLNGLIKNELNSHLVLTPAEKGELYISIRDLKLQYPKLCTTIKSSLAADKPGSAKLCGPTTPGTLALAPTFNPAGQWLWCCDLTLDGAGDFGTIADTTYSQAHALMSEEAAKHRRLREEAIAKSDYPSPDFWTCDYCNDYYADAKLKYKTQDVDTAPARKVIPLRILR